LVGNYWIILDENLVKWLPVNFLFFVIRYFKEMEIVRGGVPSSWKFRIVLSEISVSDEDSDVRRSLRFLEHFDP